jgi:uncharacterized protein (TIGR02996 family)
MSAVTEEDLLALVEGYPDDDEPRLAYARVLTERSDPRGEFIKVQCKLARHDDPSLRLVEEELLRRYGQTWAPMIADRTVGVAFRRGFVETLTFGAAGDYFRHLEAVRALRPKPVVAFVKGARVHFSRDGRRLLQVTTGGLAGRVWAWIDVWDALSGELVLHLERETVEGTDLPQDARFSEDGRSVVLCYAHRAEDVVALG